MTRRAVLPSKIEEVIEAYRQRVLLQEHDQMVIMAQRWLQVENALSAKVSELLWELEEMRQRGILVSQTELYQMQRYKALLAQARVEVQRYAEWAATLVGQRQELLSKLGLEYAQNAIRAVYWDAAKIGAYFDLLPVEAINTLIGFAGDGTPLYNLLMRDYPETIIQLTGTMLDGMALGIGPRETARQMAVAMSGNLNRALTIARTEQLRAYREASRQQMAASGVVSGYVRRCALNDRTCMACIELDGTVYDTDEVMEVHPNDRCFHQPIVKGTSPVDVVTGDEWFRGQPEDVQVDMMGPGAYDAWKSGLIDLDQLVQTHVDAVWGPTVRVAPLSSLI